MAVPAQKFREIVLQSLYSKVVGGSEDGDLLKLLMKELAVTKKTVREAVARAQEVCDRSKELDAKISAVSESYDLERIQVLERTILYLGLYEMTCDDEIPPKVAISEAIRLTRKFGSAEAARFVNAILDGVLKGSSEEDQQDAV